MVVKDLWLIVKNLQESHNNQQWDITIYKKSYFKGRNFRGQKLSRVSKIAKFRKFKFREFHFMKKIHEKNFCDFLKIFILDGNNLREWLEKVNNKHFRYHFFLE